MFESETCAEGWAIQKLCTKAAKLKKTLNLWTALQGKAPCDVPLANVRLTALKSEEFVLAMLGFAVREDWRQRLANNQVPTLTHT